MSMKKMGLDSQQKTKFQSIWYVGIKEISFSPDF